MDEQEKQDAPPESRKRPRSVENEEGIFEAEQVPHQDALEPPPERNPSRKRPRPEQSIEQKIEAVEWQIKDVEKKIVEAEQNMERAEERTFWMKQVEQLCDKEKQLRDKETQLRKEKQLRYEMKLLISQTVPPAVPDQVPQVPLDLQPKTKDFLLQYLEGRKTLSITEQGIPEFHSRPSLLLHRLREHNTDKFDAFMRKTGPFAMVVGTSGAGKTRTLYAHLCKRFGLYFVTWEIGNGGSADFRELILGTGMNRLTNDTSWNRCLMVFYTTVLLLARMQIFKFCRDQHVTAEQWLLLQVACAEMELDVFRNQARFLLAAFPSLETADQLNKWTALIRTVISELNTCELETIVLDEAQLIAVPSKTAGRFVCSLDPSKPRALAAPVVDALIAGFEYPHKVVVAGTGFTLYFHRDIASSIAKPSVEMNIFRDFEGWSEPHSMVQYAEAALGNLCERVRGVIRDEIFPVFRGRYRPFVTLLEELILSKEGGDGRAEVDELRQVFKSVRKGLTTSKRLGGVLKGFYDQILGILEGSRSPSSEVDVLLEATVRYFFAGIPYCISFPVKEDDLPRSPPYTPAQLARFVLEQGVGRVDVTNDNVVVDEPLALEAMLNVFTEDRPDIQELRRKLEQMVDSRGYRSSQGLLWQHLVPLEIYSWWKREGGVMSKMKLFNNVQLPPSLDRLKDMNSTIVEADGKPGFVVLKATPTGYNTSDYMVDKHPRCTFLVCEDGDLMWRVVFSDGTEVLLSAQLKWRDRVSRGVDAFQKAAPRRADRTKLWKGSFICLLLVYPAVLPSLPTSRKTRLAQERWRLTMKVDGDNARDVFSEDHLELLDKIRKVQPVDVVVCEVCSQQVKDEGWVECESCAAWFHALCVGHLGNGDPFVCDGCST